MAYLDFIKDTRLTRVFQYRNAHLTRLDLQQMGYSNANKLDDEQIADILIAATDKSYIDAGMQKVENMFICPKNYDIWWHNIIAECNKLDL